MNSYSPGSRNGIPYLVEDLQQLSIVIVHPSAKPLTYRIAYVISPNTTGGVCGASLAFVKHFVTLDITIIIAHIQWTCGTFQFSLYT